MVTREVANEAPILQEALLVIGVSLIGTSLGWFLMSNQLSKLGPADTQPSQTIGVESPVVLADSRPIASPSREGTVKVARPSFYLQVAACRSEIGALETAEGLQKLGFEVQIQNEGRYHRLLVGPLESRDQVTGTIDRLSSVLQSSTNMKRAIPGPWLTVQPSMGLDL